MNFKALSLVLLLFVASVSCTSPEFQRPVSQVAPNGCNIHDFGQGVWYFDCADGFGAALAEFRKNHVVVTLTSYACGQYGTSGYWVVTQ